MGGSTWASTVQRLSTLRQPTGLGLGVLVQNAFEPSGSLLLSLMRGCFSRWVACCAVLCCAVLCCAVLCCAVLCCAVLCCAVLCCAVLCCAVLCCAVLCCAALPYAVPFLTTHFHEHSAQCSCIRAWVCPDLSPHAALCRWNAHNHLLWLSRLPRLTTALRHASGQSRTCSVSLLRRGSGAASFGLLVGCLCLPLLCTSDNTLQLYKSVALP